jgi:hypothetical protein
VDIICIAVIIWAIFLTAYWLSAPIVRDSWQVQAGAVIGFFLGLLAAGGLGYAAYVKEIRYLWFVAVGALPGGMVLGAVLGKVIDLVQRGRRRSRLKKREEREANRKKRAREVHEDDLRS